MKRRQVTAILLSAILTVSSCMPMGSISAMAAENAGAGGTEAAAEILERIENTHIFDDPYPRDIDWAEEKGLLSYIPDDVLTS